MEYCFSCMELMYYRFSCMELMYYRLCIAKVSKSRAAGRVAQPMKHARYTALCMNETDRRLQLPLYGVWNLPNVSETSVVTSR